MAVVGRRDEQEHALREEDRGPQPNDRPPPRDPQDRHDDDDGDQDRDGPAQCAVGDAGWQAFHRPDAGADRRTAGTAADLVEDDQPEHGPAGGGQEREERDRHGGDSAERVGDHRPQPSTRLSRHPQQQPHEHHDRDNGPPDLNGARRPDEQAHEQRPAPGHGRRGLRSGIGEGQQREQEKRGLRGDQPGGPLDPRGDDPHGVHRRGRERGRATCARADETDEERIQRAQDHEPDPGGREGGRVGHEPAERRERGEDVHDPRRVKHRKVAIDDPPFGEGERGPHVDAVVVVDDAAQAAGQQHRHETDQECRDGKAGELQQEGPVDAEALCEVRARRRVPHAHLQLEAARTPVSETSPPLAYVVVATPCPPRGRFPTTSGVSAGTSAGPRFRCDRSNPYAILPRRPRRSWDCARRDLPPRNEGTKTSAETCA